MSSSVAEPTANDNVSPAEGSPPETAFQPQVVEACEAYINQYRCGERARVDVVKSIFGLIFAGNTTDISKHEEFARNAAFSSYLDKVDEISRSRSAAAMRGRQGEQEILGETLPDADGDEVDKELTGLESHTRGRSHSPALLARQASKKRDRSSSSESVHRSSKKPFIEALLPFIADRQSRISSSDLRPELQKTLYAKSIYARDVTQSKNSLICQPDCPQLPDPVWNDILLSKFVDLDRIFSAMLSIEGDTAETYKVGELELTAGPTKPKKHISTAGEWTISFERYKQGVIFCYPHREHELSTYASYITRQFAAVGDNNASRVINYERAVRAEVSRGNQFLLTDFHEWNALYTAFIVTPGVATQGATSTAEGRRVKDRRSNDICQRFNQGRCTNRNNCRYRHACSLCASKEHIITDCPKLPLERRK